MSSYIGIDVGGTTIKSSIVDSAGRLVRGPRIATGPGAAAALVELTKQLAAEHPEAKGIGIVSPGVVDEEAGVVRYMANLDLEGVPIVALAEEACGLPTLLSHDARAGGMAEAILGAGRNVDSFISVPIGTGISAALCHQGVMISGATHSAGEIGHIPVIPDGAPCSCGQRGCMEVYASAYSIGRRYGDLSGRIADAREVESLLGMDPHADQAWSEAVRALSLGLTHVTMTFDPSLVVIGGGLSGAGENLLGPLRVAMSDLMTWRKVPDLRVSQLGDHAGQWGAAILGSMAAGSTDHEKWTLDGAQRATG